MSVKDRHVEWVINSTISKANGTIAWVCFGKTIAPVSPSITHGPKYASVTLSDAWSKTDVHRKSCSVIDGYVAKNHACKLTRENVEQRNEEIWYLPHHPVTNPNKPGKIRMVFDAAVKFQGTYLNDQLMQGPGHINNLADKRKWSLSQTKNRCSTKYRYLKRAATPLDSYRGVETLTRNLRSIKSACTYLVPLPPLAAQVKPCGKLGC